ncbi:30S ribosomal protein S13 [Candidatus Curtissbacteria bacterium]|nr:30S ribosomal protein S13 [Candidatus Curtissbacteria bacterium]
MRIKGADIPDQKKISYSLPYIYGVGLAKSKEILTKAKIDLDKRTKDLTNDEISTLTRLLDEYRIEGDLRREVQTNIKRLQEIGSYRGERHRRNLPARGQRTRSNSRTKRGRRMTVGSVRKEDK